MKLRLLAYLIPGIIFFTCGYRLLGQATSRVDSLMEQLHAAQDQNERLDATRDLFVYYIRMDADSAAIFARQALRQTEDMDDAEAHGQSIMDLTHALYRQRKYDSVQIVLKHSIPFYKSTGQHGKVIACYRNLAAVGEKLEQPDSSLVHLDECIRLLAEHPDSNLLGQTYLSQGFAYRTKGYYELSIQSLLNSLRIFEKIQDKRRLGYVTQNLGITYGQSNRIDEAIRYTKQSIQLAGEADNLRAVGQSLNNLGLMLKRKEEFAAAASAHRESIEISRQTNQPNVVLNCFGNLGKLYVEQDKLDSAEIYYDSVFVYASALQSNFYLSETWRKKALICLRQNKIAEAERFVRLAADYDINFADPQENIDAFEDLSEAYEGLGDYKQALSYHRSANVIIDSVYLLKRDQQIAELKIVYETEKKDAEILLLNKKAELDRTRKRALLAGLILLALLAGVIIYAILLRKRKEQELIQQEKELEVERRRRAEQELEFKKKELTAKILQLARKNEFLQSLKNEVSQLKSSIDDKVNASSRRISRMIQHDSDDDEEWNQFGQEFSSVHEGFIDRLMEKHGTFTKTEMRLIALLKMNLSSKDIASTLRISTDGVKKARYRLRKKLNLESNEDLLGYIMSI